MLHALGNEPTALVMQTLGIFRLDAGNAHHAVRRLAAQMTDQSTNHPVGIDPIVVFRDHTLVPPRPLRLHRIFAPTDRASFAWRLPSLNHLNRRVAGIAQGG